MNTGVLAIIMHQLPYQFKGLPVLTTIMYLLDLVLFIICSVITILRWTMYSKVVIRKTAGNLDEIALYGAPPITFLTLAALTGLIVSKAEWGGHAWSLVAYVMWWFGMAFMLTTCKGTTLRDLLNTNQSTGMAIFITLFRTDVTDDRGMSAALTLPIVGVATAAVAGALICNFSHDISPRLAVPVIIVGYFLAGWAVWLAIILYGVYFQRLLAVGWPEPAKRPNMMMLVS
jgi:tellurite resistance protein TehA-like permease